MKRLDDDVGARIRAVDDQPEGHVAANRAALKYFCRTEEDFASAIVNDQVAISEDNLEVVVSANRAEWIAACKTVEAAAGISLAKNQLAYRTPTFKASGFWPTWRVSSRA